MKSNEIALLKAEMQSYKWDEISANGSALCVPDNVIKLIFAESEKEAKEAYWKIDNVVILQGGFYESVLPVVKCFVISLPFCSRAGLSRILEFLAQVCCGNSYAHSEGDDVLKNECVKVIGYGISTVMSVLLSGVNDDKVDAFDLLVIYAELVCDSGLARSIVWCIDNIEIPISSMIKQDVRTRMLLI